MVSSTLLFVLSLVVLITSGSWLVKSSSKISRFLHIPEFAVGFILMAVATSVPELFVGITSALNKTPSIALGTVLGSNIANLTVVMGVGVLLARKVRVQTKDARIDSLVMIAISALPVVLMLVGKSLSRIDGLILIAAFVCYYAYVMRRRKEYTKELENRITRKEGVFYSFLFIISLILLFLSADWTVIYGAASAEKLGLSPLFIGLFLIAFSTSLPELVFSARSMMTGHTEMSIGNVIGSNITNAALVLGVTAIISPIGADSLFLTAAIYMIVVSFIFTAFIESKRITWIAGLSLLMMYFFFIFLEMYIRVL